MVFVRAHVVADTVFVAVVVAVVVSVVVCATHGGDGHGERIQVVRLELKDVFACFEVVDGDDCVSRAADGVVDGLFSPKLLVVAVIVLIMIVVVMVVFVMVAMVVFVMVVFREGHVVSRIVAVEFLSILGVFRKDVNIGRARAVERSAKLADQHRFVIKRSLTTGHGVSACNKRACGDVRVLNPSVEAESVVKENISFGQANQILGRWFIVVGRFI